MNYEFQFNIGEGDTNRQITERLSRLINNADIGITADVTESDSRYALRLTSDATGVPNGKAYHFRSAMIIPARPPVLWITSD